MISRRRALLSICGAAIGALGSPRSALARVLKRGLVDSGVFQLQPKVAAHETVDARLRKDLARIANRADSEEGVPVILACENLVSNKTGQKLAPVKLTALNAAIVSEFRSNAEAWERIQPNATEGDVGKLIQILAYRDFADGGVGHK